MTKKNVKSLIFNVKTLHLILIKFTENLAGMKNQSSLYNVKELISQKWRFQSWLCWAKIARFLYYYAAFLAHSCLINPPQWLIDMRTKYPTISPDAVGSTKKKLVKILYNRRARHVH